MKKTLVAYNIMWETDGKYVDDLPDAVELPEDITEEEEITDWLSDEYGWLHNGCDVIDSSMFGYTVLEWAELQMFAEMQSDYYDESADPSDFVGFVSPKTKQYVVNPWLKSNGGHFWPDDEVVNEWGETLFREWCKNASEALSDEKVKKRLKKDVRVNATYTITTKVECSFKVPRDITREELEEFLEENRPLFDDISFFDDFGEVEDIDEFDWELVDYDSDDIDFD